MIFCLMMSDVGDEEQRAHSRQKKIEKYSNSNCGDTRAKLSYTSEPNQIFTHDDDSNFF